MSLCGRGLHKRQGQSKPVFIGEFFGPGSGFDNPLENGAKLFAAMFKGLFGESMKQVSCLGGESVIAMVANESNNR